MGVVDRELWIFERKSNILEVIGCDELVAKYNCDANCDWLSCTAFN